MPHSMEWEPSSPMCSLTEERPIAFVTIEKRKLFSDHKEALWLVYGVQNFHTYLYGRWFTLVTDHKTILGPKKGIPAVVAARLQRWALLLAAYNYIEFRSTTDHGSADALSRLPLPNKSSRTPRLQSTKNRSTSGNQSRDQGSNATRSSPQQIKSRVLKGRSW